MRSLKAFCGHAVIEMVESTMKAVRRRRPREIRTKKSAEVFIRGRGSRGDEVVEGFGLKNLRLTTQKMIKWKAVNRNMTSCEETKR